ncbi:hypothetical protein TWF694_007471 [Orbilia ellipsospora]|uniref:RNase MRP protein 1 RNA binding domain-containing protein n=1 Tax=Orbilia ellipsospora TaxID=2528407 RepID=A0AAV9XKF9_9PEZI
MSPPPTDTAPVALSPTSLASLLASERNILHLLVYKSKNQHKSSLWFKWLRMLKSSIERIISHLQETYQPTSPPSPAHSDTSSSNDDEDPKDDGNAAKLQNLKITLLKDEIFKSHLSRLHVAIIPNAFTAFTHLITSTQYAGIGMVALACLARVSTLLQPFTEVENTDIGIDIKQPQAVNNDEILKTTNENGEREGEVEDTGEVISRDTTHIITSRIRKTPTDQVDGTDATLKRRKVRISDNQEDSSDDELSMLPESNEDVNQSTKRTAIDDLFADI